MAARAHLAERVPALLRALLLGLELELALAQGLVPGLGSEMKALRRSPDLPAGFH